MSERPLMSAVDLRGYFDRHLPKFGAIDDDTCTFWAENFNDWASKTVEKQDEQNIILRSSGRLFLRHLPTAQNDEITDDSRRAVHVYLLRLDSELDWQGFACVIAASAAHACQAAAGKEPKAKNAEDPLCQFTGAVLDHYKITKSPSAVSDALRHRRGKNAKARAKNLRN